MQHNKRSISKLRLGIPERKEIIILYNFLLYLLTCSFSTTRCCVVGIVFACGINGVIIIKQRWRLLITDNENENFSYFNLKISIITYKPNFESFALAIRQSDISIYPNSIKVELCKNFNIENNNKNKIISHDPFPAFRVIKLNIRYKHL